MRRLSHRLIMVLLGVVSLVWTAAAAWAAARPVIISHTPQYTEGALVVTVQWQSENPVLRATLTAGQEQKTVKLEDDNRRIPDGYTGEVVISAPAQRSMGSDQMFYSLQLEDEYRLKSELVQGRLTMPKQVMPGMPGSMPVDDGWGQNQGRIQLPQHQPGQTGQPGQLPPVPQTGQLFQQPISPQQPGMSPGVQPPQVAYPQQQYPQQPGVAMPPTGMPYQPGVVPAQPGMMPGTVQTPTGMTPPPVLPQNPVDPGMMPPPPVDPNLMPAPAVAPPPVDSGVVPPPTVYPPPPVP